MGHRLVAGFQRPVQTIYGSEIKVLKKTVLVWHAPVKSDNEFTEAPGDANIHRFTSLSLPVRSIVSINSIRLQEIWSTRQFLYARSKSIVEFLQDATRNADFCVVQNSGWWCNLWLISPRWFTTQKSMAPSSNTWLRNAGRWIVRLFTRPPSWWPEWQWLIACSCSGRVAEGTITWLVMSRKCCLGRNSSCIPSFVKITTARNQHCPKWDHQHVRNGFLRTSSKKTRPVGNAFSTNLVFTKMGFQNPLLLRQIDRLVLRVIAFRLQIVRSPRFAEKSFYSPPFWWRGQATLAKFAPWADANKKSWCRYSCAGRWIVVEKNQKDSILMIYNCKSCRQWHWSAHNG